MSFLPIFDVLSPIINKVLDFIPDPQKKAEAQLKLQQELDANSQAILNALISADNAQAAINAEEAKSPSLFVSAWRPFIGWICGVAFSWAFVVQPMLVFIFTACGHPIDNLPQLNLSEMMPVLLGMLGLAGMRTYEKTLGVHNS